MRTTLAAILLAACFTSTATATTVQILPDSTGRFSIQMDGLTGPLTVQAFATHTVTATCIPASGQDPACPQSVWSADLSSPNETRAGDPVQSGAGGANRLAGLSSGTIRSFTDIDEVFVTLTPGNPVLDLFYVSNISSTAFVSSVLFTLTFDTGAPVALVGDVLKGVENPGTVPIPAALPLLGAGLAGLGFLSRRKRKAV